MMGALGWEMLRARFKPILLTTESWFIENL